MNLTKKGAFAFYAWDMKMRRDHFAFFAWDGSGRLPSTVV